MEDLENRITRIIRSMPIFEERDSVVVELRNNLPPHAEGKHLTAQYCSISRSDYDMVHCIEIPEDISEKATGFTLFYNEEVVLGNLSVHPNYRRMGIGRGFVDIAESIARELGIKKLKIGSPNEEFFRHLGYRIENRYAIKK